MIPSVVIFGPADVGKTLLLGAMPQAANLPGAPGDFTFRMLGEATAIRDRMQDALQLGQATPTGEAGVGTIGARKYTCELYATRHIPTPFPAPPEQHRLELELWDTPGADLTQQGGALARRVREADILVLCLNLNDGGMVEVGSQVAALVNLAAETQFAPAPPASTWAKLVGWLLPATVHRDDDTYRALSARRVLVLLTRVDEFVSGLGAPAGAGLGCAAALDPVAQAVRLLGEARLHEIVGAFRRDAEVGVGLVSSWGFCKQTGDPYIQAQGLPNHRAYRTRPHDRVRDWQPFGVRDALRFLVTGEASGRVRRVYPGDVSARYGPLPPLPLPPERGVR